ncbi:hypothetical protein MRB53_014154 [Persea americana]|uniref:Uncharacterized protein n=1 Tax=Persea americana TaxID=3435 RepID=A0ACC2KAN7_PERAE|nr:hypothetical protein MRB53_014154 [Persea americana]
MLIALSLFLPFSATHRHSHLSASSSSSISVFRKLLEGKSCLASVKKLITATLTSTVHALYPGICFIRPATAESAAAAATIEGLVYRDWTLSQARTAAVCTVPGE